LYCELFSVIGIEGLDCLDEQKQQIVKNLEVFSVHPAFHPAHHLIITYRLLGSETNISAIKENTPNSEEQ
jgi:hypothetical protein